MFKIIDPTTKKSVTVFEEKGLKILKNYIKTYIGGNKNIKSMLYNEDYTDKEKKKEAEKFKKDIDYMQNLLSQSTDVFLFGDARHGASSIEYFFNLIKHDLIDKESLNNLVLYHEGGKSIINLVENFKKLLNKNGISNESINLDESAIPKDFNLKQLTKWNEDYRCTVSNQIWAQTILSTLKKKNKKYIHIVCVGNSHLVNFQEKEIANSLQKNLLNLIIRSKTTIISPNEENTIQIENNIENKTNPSFCNLTTLYNSELFPAGDEFDKELNTFQ